jgi:hypothetical protein
MAVFRFKDPEWGSKYQGNIEISQKLKNINISLIFRYPDARLSANFPRKPTMNGFDSLRSLTAGWDKHNGLALSKRSASKGSQ